MRSPSKAARWRPFVFLAFAACVATTLWAAGAQRIAVVQVGPGQISWTPEVRAERWLLTVSGQGIYLREVYQGGEIPSFRSIAPVGQFLADGSYNWELRAIDQEPSGTAARGEAEEEEPRQMDTARGTFERRIVRRPLVTSGSFLVEGGSFVVPRAEDREQEDRQTSGGE